MRPLRARRPLCRDELSCFFVFLFNDTKADWMKCQAHHVAHSCSISRRESVRGPNSLHHWVLKGAWVIAAYLYEWAVWDGSCKEAHVLLFSFYPWWCHNQRLPEHKVHSQSPAPNTGNEHQTSCLHSNCSLRACESPLLLLFAGGIWSCVCVRVCSWTRVPV